MDFQDINQSTVTSMADLIENDESNNEVFEDRFTVNKVSSKLDEKQVDFARQVSIASSVLCKSPPVKVTTVLKQEWRMVSFIALLFIIMVSGVALIYHFYKIDLYSFDLGQHIHFDEISRKLQVYNENKQKILDGILGQNLPSGAVPYNCYPEDVGINNWEVNRTCVGWKNKAELRIDYTTNPQHVNCYRFSWTTFTDQYYPYDCFALSEAFWYGGVLAGIAPFHERMMTRQPFFTSTTNGDSKIGSVIEPYWITSNSVAIIVEGNPPLHFSVNENNNKMLCLISQYSNTAYHNYNGNTPGLNYSICSGADMKQVHSYVLQQYYAHTTSEKTPPDVSKFKQPIYSTWANFKDKISEKVVLSYVNQLEKNDLMRGVVLLQEGWEVKHGDIQFDSNGFPNVTGMVEEIRKKGFDVGITVTHMVATDSQIFQDRIKEEILVMDAGNSAPGLVQYWLGPHTEPYYNGFTAAFDTAYLESIKPHKFYNLHSSVVINYISMEGAQADVLPYHSTFKDHYSSPNQYTQAFAEFSTKDVPWVPMQAMYKCQHCNGFIMLYDFNSTVSRCVNGLEAVVPSVISLGLMGYPFVIAGAIGGSNYNASLPSKQLYIRWMQLVTFLPVMHFSIPPDAYDLHTVTLAKELLTLHNNFVVPEIQKVLITAARDLHPIVRPLWWFDPGDERCIDIDDQFMLGDCVMVAPVLNEGYTQRDVYIPKGTWTDKNTNRTLSGPLMFSKYPADFNTVPYFLLQNCHYF